ncbi:MAG: phosphotransferase [Bacteroidia bacterium]
MSLPQTLLKNQYNIDPVEIRQLPGELDLNYYIRTNENQSYILKVSHAGENEAELDMQNQAMAFLRDRPSGLKLPFAIPNLSGKLTGHFEDEAGEIRRVRLLTWVDGKVWAKVNPHTPELLFSLGKACGSLTASLQGFDHPSAHRNYKWDLASFLWVENHRELFPDSEQKALFDYFIELYKSQVLPVLSSLRESANHNDANDYNILVSVSDQPTVISLIDFGDMVFTKTIYELAIAAAYALMNKPDPLSAGADLVRGFYSSFPLTETEIKVLFPLIAARLLTSVTHAAINRRDHPENAYLQISEKPAWDLLAKLRQISPAFAHFTFRHACGMEPCPSKQHFLTWASNQSFAPLTTPALTYENAHFADFSVGSTELGGNAVFEDVIRFDRHISRMLEDSEKTGIIGRYDEARPFYTTDNYLTQGNEGPVWRTVHLGLDVFLPSETPVHAVYEGYIHSFADNRADRDYGPTVIVEHQPSDGPVFYTLYGHLSRGSLNGLTKGKKVEKGETIGYIGMLSENGGWPPHLHFQVILDMLSKAGDFPGVGFPHSGNGSLHAPTHTVLPV